MHSWPREQPQKLQLGPLETINKASAERLLPRSPWRCEAPVGERALPAVTHEWPARVSPCLGARVPFLFAWV